MTSWIGFFPVSRRWSILDAILPRYIRRYSSSTWNRVGRIPPADPTSRNHSLLKAGRSKSFRSRDDPHRRSEIHSICLSFLLDTEEWAEEHGVGGEEFISEHVLSQ